MVGRRDPGEDAIAAGVRDLRAPGEPEALDRALELAAREHSARAPALRTGPPRRRLTAGLVAAAAGLAAALALTPAGAAVGDWIGDVVDEAPPPARNVIGHLPSGGTLLVDSRQGPWVVSEDGSRRLLGDYDSATWSPRGLFVAVSSGRTLSALDPEGGPRWSIDAPQVVEDARWSTSGQRVAYRSGDALRLVAGDGTGDRELVRRVAAVPPSWMPVDEGALSPNLVAYADPAGGVVTLDVDSGRRLATFPTAQSPLSIDWYDRGHLLIVERHGLEIADVGSGDVASLLRVPGRDRIAAAVASPDGSEVAVLQESGGRADGARTRSAVRLTRIPDSSGRAFRTRVLFSGLGRFDGPVFSPDGSRVLLGWSGADQWLFIGADRAAERRGRRDPLSIGDISRQFDPGVPRGVAAFPRIEGWCCG